MADTSFLFGSAPPTSISADTVETSATLPAWLQDYTRGLMGKSVQVAGEAYTPYTGDRIADQTALQTQANQNVIGQQGSWQPGMNFAGDKSFNQVGNYMNPYISAVNQNVATLGQRNLSENLLPQVNSTFTGAGQFGSTRNADFTNRAVRDANESILNTQNQNLNTGYNQAVQAFQNDATRAGNVANMGTQLGYQDAGMLSQVGQTEQGLQQQGLDLAYQDFQNQINYPKANLQFLNEMMRGLPANMAQQYPTSSTVTAPQTISPLQAAAQGFAGMRSALAGPATTTTAQKTTG